MSTSFGKKIVLASGIAMALFAASPAFSADGDKSKVKGLITKISGDTVYLKDANNAQVTITLGADTTYKKTKGLTGAIHDKVEKGALLPGLPISADVVAEGSDLKATAISFKAEDFRTAQQVDAGTQTTKQRMDDFGTYDALATVDVLFDSGKTAISAKGKSDLDSIAAKSKDTKDFRIVVQGFTDSTGNAAANQKLSVARAQAVTDYLQQNAGISPGRVFAGDGMGIAADAGTGSNANARKVVVKLVVDKGVSGGQ